MSDADKQRILTQAKQSLDLFRKSHGDCGKDRPCDACELAYLYELLVKYVEGES